MDLLFFVIAYIFVDILRYILGQHPPTFWVNYNTSRLYKKIMAKLNKMYELEKKSDRRGILGEKLENNITRGIKEEKKLRDTVYKLIRLCQDKNESVRVPLLIWQKYLVLMDKYTDDWAATAEYGIEPDFNMIDEYINVMNAYKKTLVHWLRYKKFE